MKTQWAIGWVVMIGCFGCGLEGKQRGAPAPKGGSPREPSPQTGGVDAGFDDAGAEAEDAGVPDEGVADAGLLDAGAVDAGAPDAGALDAGSVDAGTWTPGAWPDSPALNYSTHFGIDPVQSVGVDDASNLWLLAGDRIGVLRPGELHPHWTSGVGQAAQGFGPDALALGSTVICGGAAGQAYVGYAAADLSNTARTSTDDPEYLKGDLDLVAVAPDGAVSLQTHVSQSVVYQGSAQQRLGIRNSNDWHYDEDRTVLTCHRLMRGPNRGDLFIGTNHGVTMIRGAVYNSHRHPVWDVNGSLRIGYSFALGSSFDGAQVLIGNEWKIGILKAPADLALWDRSVENPWVLDTFVAPLNSLELMDYWRGFTQAKEGSYYLASERYGLWKMAFTPGAAPTFTSIAGLPTSALGAVQATDDGSVFIATSGNGLWRLLDSGQLTPVAEVAGSRVKQLVYDPTAAPSMLFVLTEAGLTVLRGH